MNNAFFGKTMENVRERVNLEIIPHTKIDQIIKRQSKSSFKGISIHYNDFSLYNYDKEKTGFDKPIYMGFSNLELSKLLMYEFNYHKLHHTITAKSSIAQSNCNIWIQTHSF